MRPLGLVETERARDRGEDTLGNARQVAAFHPVVVVDADSGQGRHFLPPEACDLSRPVRGEADLIGRDLCAPRSEEIPYLGLGVHSFETKPRPRPRGCPVSTWPGPSSHPVPEPCFREGNHQHRRKKCRSPGTGSTPPLVPTTGSPGTSTSTSSACRRRPHGSWAEWSTSRREPVRRGTPTRSARPSWSP